MAAAPFFVSPGSSWAPSWMGRRFAPYKRFGPPQKATAFCGIAGRCGSVPGQGRFLQPEVSFDEHKGPLPMAAAPFFSEKSGCRICGSRFHCLHQTSIMTGRIMGLRLVFLYRKLDMEFLISDLIAAQSVRLSRWQFSSAVMATFRSSSISPSDSFT